tara:strand:- start:128 stop:325 length:198 start_codon:yes stop_codon:yes gene_type:complete
MERVINHIVCDDCGADFEIKYNEDEKEPAYCPFCGADLFWDDEEDESEESDIYLEWSDPNDDEYE